jgi:hypothetical protein
VTRALRLCHPSTTFSLIQNKCQISVSTKFNWDLYFWFYAISNWEIGQRIWFFCWWLCNLLLDDIQFVFENKDLYLNICWCSLVLFDVVIETITCMLSLIYSEGEMLDNRYHENCFGAIWILNSGSLYKGVTTLCATPLINWQNVCGLKKSSQLYWDVKMMCLSWI